MKRLLLAAFLLLIVLLSLTASRTFQVANVGAAAGPGPDTVTTVPLYRLFAHTTGIHFYTIDASRKQQAVAAGWTAEASGIHVLSQQAPGTVPLYVLVTYYCFSLATDKCATSVFGYTTDEQEVKNLLHAQQTPQMLCGADGSSHWKLDGSGIAGYIAKTQLPGTVPLYRLYHQPLFGPEEADGSGSAVVNAMGGSKTNYSRKCLFNSYDNLYTASPKEKAGAEKVHGYQYLRIEGYVWPQPTTVSMQPAAAPSTVPKIDTGHNAAPNPDTILLNLACVRSAVGEYKCETQRGYETCQLYKQQGSVKACSTTVNPLVQAAIDKELFSLGCNRLLGRADEFLCKTQKGLDLCETYRKNGKLKKCLMAKQ